MTNATTRGLVSRIVLGLNKAALLLLLLLPRKNSFSLTFHCFPSLAQGRLRRLQKPGPVKCRPAQLDQTLTDSRPYKSTKAHSA